MEVAVGQKHKQLEFAVASVSELASPSSKISTSSTVVACFGFDSGVAEVRFYRESNPDEALHVALPTSQLFKLSPVESVCISEGSETGKEQSYSRAITIQFRKDEESRAFHCAFEQWKKEGVIQGSCFQNGTLSASKSKFDDKIELSSAKMYFHYYGQLLHQQNMLQDYVRTGCISKLLFVGILAIHFLGLFIEVILEQIRIMRHCAGTYYAAVIENRTDFVGRVVVDVGAGSGILSLFAAQAGAKHVYAVEASEMAEYARKLIAGNPFLGERITVVKGKIEEVELPEKADILISEPMGTLLVNERMLETYVIARDRFLVPNGKMFPTNGRLSFGSNKIITVLT